MKRYAWLGLILLVSIPLDSAQATSKPKPNNRLAAINDRISGQVVDHTANHDRDRRIWSKALGKRRDLYVYLPPNYSKDQRYPVIMFLHAFSLDEQSFLDLVPMVDNAICKGKLPPVIMAAPDGSTYGEPCIAHPGTFFMNSQLGDFEDFLLQDVWDFVSQRYPIRAERKAHVLAGVSMGGFAAFNLGIRHRDAFGIAVGVHPPLNTRWMDAKGNYFAHFDPRNWGWRTDLNNPLEPIANFAGGAVKIRIKDFAGPLYGLGEDAIVEIARQNPIELVDRTALKNGDLAMYVGYAGRDEFNVTAQVESFLYLCKHRQIDIAVGYEAHGRHNSHTAAHFVPSIFEWLSPQLAPYAPPAGIRQIGR